MFVYVYVRCATIYDREGPRDELIAHNIDGAHLVLACSYPLIIVPLDFRIVPYR